MDLCGKIKISVTMMDDSNSESNEALIGVQTQNNSNSRMLKSKRLRKMLDVDDDHNHDNKDRHIPLKIMRCRIAAESVPLASAKSTTADANLEGRDCLSVSSLMMSTDTIAGTGANGRAFKNDKLNENTDTHAPTNAPHADVTDFIERNTPPTQESSSMVHTDNDHFCPCQWGKCREYTAFFNRTDDLYKGIVEVELPAVVVGEGDGYFNSSMAVRRCIETNLGIHDKKRGTVWNHDNSISNDKETVQTERYRIALHHFSWEYVLDLARQSNSNSSHINRKKGRTSPAERLVDIASISIDAATADRYMIPKETYNEFYEPPSCNGAKEALHTGGVTKTGEKDTRYIIAPSNSERHVKDYIKDAQICIEQSLLIVAAIQKSSTEKMSIPIPPGKLRITVKALLNVGIYVEKVRPNSPVFNILHAGDVIFRFNGIPLYGIPIANFTDMMTSSTSLSFQHGIFTVVPARAVVIILTALYRQSNDLGCWISKVGMATTWKAQEENDTILSTVDERNQAKITQEEQSQAEPVLAKLSPRIESSFDKEIVNSFSVGEISMPVLDVDSENHNAKKEQDNNTLVATARLSTSFTSTKIQSPMNNNREIINFHGSVSSKINDAQHGFTSHPSLTCIRNKDFQPSLSSTSKLQHEQYLLQHVAKMFRKHAMLYLKHATYLEHMACYPNNPSRWGVGRIVSIEDLDNKIKMESTVDIVKKSYKSMIRIQSQIDRILERGIMSENLMSPWDTFEKQAEKKISKEPKYIRLKKSKSLKHKYLKLSKYVGQRKLECWKSLSLEEKEHYLSAMASTHMLSQCIIQGSSTNSFKRQKTRKEKRDRIKCSDF